MNLIEGSDRQQTHLLPAAVEDYIGKENPVRFLDAFVMTLDLATAGFEFPKTDSRRRGRPAYHPADLLKLYLYGYLNQMRSSRRLETECYRNLEVIWLMRQLKPDHKTIADFRKDNADAFKSAMREFTRVCRDLDLYGGQLLAVDGTKIKASNAIDQNWSQRKLDKQMAAAEARLEEYLKALEEADAQDAQGGQSVPGNAAQLQGQIQRLTERKAQIQERLNVLAESGASQLSQTDPESRGMKGAHGYVVGYNVQGCVDAKHHLLVCTELTNNTVDHGQLSVVAREAKATLEIEQAEVLADGGYFKSQDIKDCQDLGMEPLVPSPDNSPSERKGLYGKDDFRYDAEQDVYHCPSGAQLDQRRQTEDKGRILFNYDNPKACAQCRLKAKCTASKYRTISRWEHEARLERMAKAVAAAPQKVSRRKALIEHCWATLKWLLPGGFLVRGKVKAGAELSLAHFCYNLKRVLAVVGLEKLMEKLKKPKSEASLGPKAASQPHGLALRQLKLVASGYLYQPLQFQRFVFHTGSSGRFNVALARSLNLPTQQ